MKKSTVMAGAAAAAVLALGAFLGVVYRSGSGTMGQTVNAAIDDLAAAGARLLDLPVIMLLAAAGVLGAGLTILVARWGTTSRRVTFIRVAPGTLAGLMLFGLALAADRKMHNLQAEVNDLRARLQDLQMTGLEDRNRPAGQVPTPVKVPELPTAAGSATSRVLAAQTRAAPAATLPLAKISPAAGADATPAPARRSTPMIDVERVPRDLNNIFGRHTFRPVVYDQATDVVEVRVYNPPIVAWVAVVDLRTPGLVVHVGGTVTGKTLTTDFARNNRCGIAINGEAGNSPAWNSGLGSWTGHFINQGQVLLQEKSGNRRPFLVFDKQNHATFTAMAAANRTPGPDPYNVIWGRLDAVVNGNVQTQNERDRQPRTAMGIDKDGTRLFLLVVDGRQQRYSIGFTRAEVGATLQAFGAFNGMLCDEGGSSCMYVKNLGGIVNSPSDGAERPTYTHFGVSLH
jgi:hypothetical protein